MSSAPFLLLWLAAAPAPAPALPPELQRVQGVLQEHMKGGVPETKVGAFVLYQFAGGAGTERVHFVRLAVTGEAVDAQGRPAWWMELEVGTHAKLVAPMAQMKMLVAKTEGISAKGVSRMIVSWGTVKPQELDAAAIAVLLKPPERDPAEPAEAPGPKAHAEFNTRTGKPTRLVTLGGTVEAVPVEIRLRATVVKRIWLSRQVPLLQLARLELPAIDHSMELRDYGFDAKPRILMPPEGSPLVGVTRFDDESLLPDLSQEAADAKSPNPSGR